MSDTLQSSAPLRPLTIAHDYFTQRGGAERVASSLIEVLHPERIVTSTHVPERTFPLPAAAVETSFLQAIPGLRRDPRWALLLLPLAWRSVPPVRSGVVLCSSSGWAHRIRVGSGVVKVVYCHNPARWIFQADDYLQDRSPLLAALARLARPALLRGDRAAAATATRYVANSTSVAARIRAAYGIEAVVVHPPVTIDAAGPQDPVATGFGSFFLTIARGRGYKHTGALIDAFRTMPEQHLVVVGGLPAHVEPPENVRTTGRVTDAELRWLYAHCRALMSVAHEDFGLTPLEANMLGSPALVLRAGGFLDSMAEGISGRYIEDESLEQIVHAVRSFPEQWDRDLIRAHADHFSMASFLVQLIRVIQPGPEDPGSEDGGVLVTDAVEPSTTPGLAA